MLNKIILAAVLLTTAGCSDNIDYVKNYVLEDKTVTISGVLDNYQYFQNKSWTETKDPQKRIIVSFRGTFKNEEIEETKEIFGQLNSGLDSLRKTYAEAKTKTIPSFNIEEFRRISMQLDKTLNRVDFFKEFLNSKKQMICINFVVNIDKSGTSIDSAELVFLNLDKEMKETIENTDALLEGFKNNKKIRDFLMGDFIDLPKSQVDGPPLEDHKKLVKQLLDEYISKNPSEFSGVDSFKMSVTNKWKNILNGDVYYFQEIEADGGNKKFIFIVSFHKQGDKWYAKFKEFPKQK